MRSITKLYQLNNTLFNNKVFCFFSAHKYTKNHEWVDTLQKQSRVRVGISDYAQSQLGEIVHVQLPTIGKTLKSGDSAMTIESVKMAADVYTPVSGKVVRVNQDVSGNPGAVNQKAEDVWLFEVQYSQEPTDLLSPEQYKKLTQQSH